MPPLALNWIYWLPAVGSAFAAVDAVCAAAEATVLSRTGLIDLERSALEFLAIESDDCALGRADSPIPPGRPDKQRNTDVAKVPPVADLLA